MFDAYAVNTLTFNAELCNGCGMCANVCPHGVFEVNARKVTIVRAQSCMECGACQLNCPTGAVTVESGVGCAAAMTRDALMGRKVDEWGSNAQTSCGRG